MHEALSDTSAESIHWCNLSGEQFSSICWGPYASLSSMRFDAGVRCNKGFTTGNWDLDGGIVGNNVTLEKLQGPRGDWPVGSCEGTEVVSQGDERGRRAFWGRTGSPGGVRGLWESSGARVGTAMCFVEVDVRRVEGGAGRELQKLSCRCLSSSWERKGSASRAGPLYTCPSSQQAPTKCVSQ